MGNCMYGKTVTSEISICVLGAGESGKSTLIRQFGQLQDIAEVITDLDLKTHRPFVLKNLLEGANLLLEFSKTSPEYTLQGEENKKAALTVLQFFKANEKDDKTGVDDLNAEVGEALIILANNQKFLSLLDHSSKLQVPDGWSYFMEKIKDYPKWGGTEWKPDKNDLLHVRHRTVGIIEKRVTFENNNFRIYDVGGQVISRKKWVVAGEKTDIVIWMQSLSDYDQIMFEDEYDKNRFVDSRAQFAKTMNSDLFKDKGLLIFLNKEDLLKKKFCDLRIPIDPSLGTEANPSPVYKDELTPEQNMAEVKDWYRRSLAEVLDDPKRAKTARSLSALEEKTVRDVKDYLIERTIGKVLDAGGFLRPESKYLN